MSAFCCLLYTSYKVYLLSNYPKDYFELHTHSELSFVSLVDGKVNSAMVGMIKPDAGIYQLSLIHI